MADLIDYLRNSNREFRVSRYYIKEAVYQILEAYKIIPYVKSPYFEALGTPSNLFFNFYYYLKTSNLLTQAAHEDYETWLTYLFVKKNAPLMNELKAHFLFTVYAES